MKLLQSKKFIALYILAVFVILLILHASDVAAVNTYPTHGWQISTPEAQGMQSQMLAEMMAYKDGKFIIVCAHPWKNHYKAESIVLSLAFK